MQCTNNEINKNGGIDDECKTSIRCNRFSVSNADCKNEKAMDTLQTGEVLEVHVTDKGSIKDIPAWANKSGHDIVKHVERR